MVGLPKRRHHFPFNEAVTAEAASAIEPLVVTCANVLTLPHKEATLGQVTATRCGEDQRLGQWRDQLMPRNQVSGGTNSCLRSDPSPLEASVYKSKWLTIPEMGLQGQTQAPLLAESSVFSV